jgi:hypothetical protein
VMDHTTSQTKGVVCSKLLLLALRNLLLRG